MALQKRDELLTRWKQQKRPIVQNWRAAYALATAIAIGLAIHPRDSDWGVSMLQACHGHRRFKQSTPEEWKFMSSKGGFCARTTRRTERRRRELEAELKTPGIGPDGLLPTAWYKQETPPTRDIPTERCGVGNLKGI